MSSPPQTSFLHGLLFVHRLSQISFLIPNSSFLIPVSSSHMSQIILSNVCDFESQRHRFS